MAARDKIEFIAEMAARTAAGLGQPLPLVLMQMFKPLLDQTGSDYTQADFEEADRIAKARLQDIRAKNRTRAEERREWLRRQGIA